MIELEIQPVIMAGGSGTRLWPLSRAGYPKQFLVLSGNSSLFQQAAERLADLKAPRLTVAPPLGGGNEEHRFLVLEQLRELPADVYKVEAGQQLLAVYWGEKGGSQDLQRIQAFILKWA